MTRSACFKSLFGPVCATISDSHLFALPKLLYILHVFLFFGHLCIFVVVRQRMKPVTLVPMLVMLTFLLIKMGFSQARASRLRFTLSPIRLSLTFVHETFVPSNLLHVKLKLYYAECKHYRQTTSDNKQLLPTVVFMAIVAVKPARTGTRNNRDTLTHTVCTGLPIFLSSNVLYLPDTFFQLLLVLFLGLTSIIVRFFCIVVMHYSCWLFVTEVSK